MINKIVVALDGSDLSDQVIKALFNLQLHAETQVVLTHVIANLGTTPEIAADRPQAETESIPYQYLEQLQSYQSQLPCKSEIEIVTGDPADEIVRLANIHQADLIVIGSRGLTGVNRILQGSVSGQVVADAHCSVMVVKP